MANTRSLLESLETLARTLVRDVQEIETWANQHAQRVAADQEAKRQALTEARRRDVLAAADQFGASMARVRELDQRLRAAAGLAAVPWTDPSWDNPVPAQAPPAAVRVGDFRLQGRPGTLALPAMLSVDAGFNLLLTATEERKASAVGAAAAIALRLLALHPPGSLRLLLIDPVALGDNLAVFMHLADHMRDLVSGKVWVERADIERELANLSAHMETVIQTYLRGHYASMAEYNADAGEVAEPYRLVVVTGFPTNFSEEAAARLLSIAKNGPRCGVSTVVVADPGQPLPRGFSLAALAQQAQVIGESKDHHGLRWQGLEQPGLQLDAPPPHDRFERILHAVGAAAQAASTVQMPFDKIAPPREKWWQGDAAAGLTTAIGRSGARRPQLFELGTGMAVHALVAGRTGSGKSTLMHVLITGLAVTYAPEELELYLIDFKKGVEFKDYATCQLPHARVVAIEGEREFGLSVLQGLDAEMERRAVLFRNAECGSLAEYRRRNPDGKGLPRVLLLVDEFQEFFAADDAIARQAAQLLDRLARQGRSFGVHMVLGTQSLAGAWSLGRSTIDQMAVRVALQCSEADSRLILSDDNPAARLLTRAGEAFYNGMSGLKEGNSRFQVAWLPEADRRRLLGEVQALATAPGRHYGRPIVFEGNAPARLEDRDDHPLAALLAQPGWPAQRKPEAWLGAPVAIKAPTAAVFTRRRRGRNLAIIGRDEAQAAGMFATSLVSLATQHPPGSATLYVCDLTPAGAEDSSYLEALQAAFPEHVRLLQPRRLLSVLGELAATVASRTQEEQPAGPSFYLCLFGLHRARDLRRDDDTAYRRRPEDPPRPTDQFVTLLREGPEVGVHTLLWCESMAALGAVVDRRGQGEFGMRVALSMPERESTEWLDTPAAGRLAPFRALYLDDERTGQLEKFRPYSPPPPAWLEQTGRRLQQKSAGGERPR